MVGFAAFRATACVLGGKHGQTQANACFEAVHCGQYMLNREPLAAQTHKNVGCFRPKLHLAQQILQQFSKLHINYNIGNT